MLPRDGVKVFDVVQEGGNPRLPEDFRFLLVNGEGDGGGNCLSSPGPP